MMWQITGGGVLLVILTLSCHTSTFELGLGPAPSLNVSKTYDSNFRPNQGAVADVVSVSIESLNIQQVQENALTVDLVLRQAWTDPRLANVVNKSSLFTRDLPKVWTPDLYILHTETGVDRNSGSVRVKPLGEIILTRRIVSRIQCQMSYFKFPFDRQTCLIKVESYGHSMIHMEMVWRGSVPMESVQLFDSEFSLLTLDQSSEKERRSSGEYRTLVMTIGLGRSGLQWMRRLMLPTFILSILAFITIFLGRNSGQNQKGSGSVGTENTVPGSVPYLTLLLIRLAITGFLFLIYIIVIQMSFLNTPRTATITALDAWSTFHGFFILLIFIINILRLIQLQRSSQGSCMVKTEKYLLYGFPLLELVFLVIFFATVLI